MSLHCSIVLDSGTFMAPNPTLDYDTYRVGYFECKTGCPDVRIYVDGEEASFPLPFKLGNDNSTIDIVHFRSNGERHLGISKSATLQKYLLKREDLYDGEKVRVNESEFDCILRFHSGHFRCSMVRNRCFKEMDSNGAVTGTVPRERTAIAHDIVVSYDLVDGDELMFVKGATILWTSRYHRDARREIVLELLADDVTALKYFKTSIANPRPCYWVPNQGHPPPSSCPPPDPTTPPTGP